MHADFQEVRKDSPLVSVCIPAFNAGQYIAETILSIVGQEYKKVEIIVSDNCSTDNTLEVVLDLADKFKGIMVIKNSTNIGMASNWNKVIQAAKGEFVMLVNADDKLDGSFIMKALEDFASNDEIDIVSFNFQLLKNGYISRRKVVLARGIYRDFSGILLSKNPFQISFAMFSRRALNRLNSNNGLFVRNLLTCDYDLWFRTAENNLTVYYDDRPLGTYRIHLSNLSRARIRMMRQTLLVILSRSNYLRKYHFFDLMYSFSRLIFWYIYCTCFSGTVRKDRKFFRLLICRLLFKVKRNCLSR